MINTKKCTICGHRKIQTEFTTRRAKCKSCQSIIARAKNSGIITINYDPAADGKAWVKGIDVRIARELAGIATTYDMSFLCKWSQTCQVKYEQFTRHLIEMENIWKMIRVCNGER